jgi:hypothetical protein
MRPFFGSIACSGKRLPDQYVLAAGRTMIPLTSTSGLPDRERDGIGNRRRENGNRTVFTHGVAGVFI